ncbi:hypothetical protein GE107_06310 [Cohnella sp. CFH 77786]|uniref:hypothetical protein n=1 Tax=Cohnella sp. CFH 77786 TaxID=2662265 RepID=UPI001C60ABEA|nr:hypothetical protein [Cohnella sp. CFH 77786]MBW5445677.1 hypothetical protein [Cohnella sp. CFH 77786]
MSAAYVILFVLLSASLARWQVRGLLAKGETKDAACYALLMAAAAAIGALLLAGVQLPSPNEPLRAVFEPVGKWIFPGLG